jgi:hypothetical protein
MRALSASSASEGMTNKKRVSVEPDLDLLNENHQLRLRITFEHIDSLLSEVEQILIDSASESPFNRYRADATPIQQKVAHDYALRIRAAMARIMAEQQIALAEPRCGSRRAANTALRRNCGGRTGPRSPARLWANLRCGRQSSPGDQKGTSCTYR